MYAFRAMNTDVAVVVEGGDERAAAARVAETFARAEARFSRFREDSELSRLNRARGPVTVSAEMFAALARARGYVERTGGLFDPGVGATLAALGYDRSFAPGALDRVDRYEPAARTGSFRDVLLDPRTRTVTRPEHVTIDLGGMVKGATVDAAAEHLPARGAVDAGGDAVLHGPAPGGVAWLVEIEDPADPARALAVVAVPGGAVATSAANRRVWRAGGARMHHLIDPRTQRPAVTDVRQATVFASRAELADVLAKTAFLLGAREARGFLERQPGVGAVLVKDGGELVLVGDLDLREVNHA